MILGVHVSTAGKVYYSIDRAKALRANTMQIFSRSPQNWREGSLEEADIKEFKKRRLKARLNPVFIHVSYLINLASPNRRLYEGSIKAYIEDIFEAQKLGADYIVTHMGSHKDTSEEEGIMRFGKALDRIIEKTHQSGVGILLENTSGSGSWLGYKFIHHKMIIDSLKDTRRIGLCFDTCHAYAAGYNIKTQEGLESTLEEINYLVGIDRLKLVHLNDAKERLNSRRDKHEHIGKGYIGLDGFKRIVNHPKLKNLPFILETPKESEKSDKMNLKTVRSLL